jgi:hypothetical protein
MGAACYGDSEKAREGDPGLSYVDRPVMSADSRQISGRSSSRSVE